MDHPQLFVGIDVSKESHIAGFLSPSLLSRHKRFHLCPTLRFAQSRTGVDALLKRIKSYGPISRCCVLLEQTGHYHRALEETLQAEGITVYVISVHAKKANGRDKTDKRDALRLANLLYNQVALGMQVDDATQRVDLRLPPIPAAAELRPLVRMHYEWTQSSTRVSNKLTALCDEIFPEFTQVMRDPNLANALNLRERFPTPAVVAAATIDQLKSVREGNRPGAKQLQELQKLAETSIGVKDCSRLSGLILEQSQLITSLRLINSHLAVVDEKIAKLLAESREGQILRSIPGIGPNEAAFILAAIGNIRNFERASQLKRYFGFSPHDEQTGISLDKSTITRVGTRLMKGTIYLMVIRAITSEPWAELYDRLVQRKCTYNARTKKWQGKSKVIARVAGQIITMIFAFLKRDAELVDATPEGETPSSPALYDPATHQAHRRRHIRRTA